MTQDEFIDHFVQSAEYDYAAMKRVFGASEYVWAVFVAALMIERLPKAACIRVHGAEEPATYNLVHLAAMAGLETSNEQKETMCRLTLMNIRARHPDRHRQAHSFVTRDWAGETLANVEEFRAWLLQKLSNS